MCCALGVVSSGLTEFNCVCGRGAQGDCVVRVIQPQSGRKTTFHSPLRFYEQEGAIPKLLTIPPTGEELQLLEWASCTASFCFFCSSPIPLLFQFPSCKYVK